MPDGTGTRSWSGLPVQRQDRRVRATKRGHDDQRVRETTTVIILFQSIRKVIIKTGLARLMDGIYAAGAICNRIEYLDGDLRIGTWVLPSGNLDE